MIHVTVTEGLGDRPAEVISDDLIVDETMAYIRAVQEMVAHRAIIRERTLDIPHSPSLEIGDIKEVICTRFNLYGNNEITSSNINIANGLITHSVNARQIYGYTP